MVSINITTTRAMVALVIGLSLSSPAAAQTTIFNTKDFRQDRARWTDPAYYLNNKPGELRSMALDAAGEGEGGQLGRARKYGSAGTGKPGAVNFASPYPYKTAWEHYQAWLKEANGGTKHTRETLPNWSGRWRGGGGFVAPNGFEVQVPASDVVKLLTPEYQEYYVQDMKATSEGRIWRAGAFCLPGGFIVSLVTQEFILTPEQVWTTGGDLGTNTIRWIYTNRDHSPEQFQYPKWHGESIGFWNGDTLIIHTNQIHGWRGGLSEFSDSLEAVERYRRVGDEIQGEVTLYDPVVFVRPVYTPLRFRLDKETRMELMPRFNPCTDTDGPTAKLFMDERGLLNERIPGDPLHWDPTEPRPWAAWLNESDKRWAQYKKTQQGR